MNDPTIPAVQAMIGVCLQDRPDLIDLLNARAEKTRGDTRSLLYAAVLRIAICEADLSRKNSLLSIARQKLDDLQYEIRVVEIGETAAFAERKQKKKDKYDLAMFRSKEKAP